MPRTVGATMGNVSRAPFCPFRPASAVSVGDLPTLARMHKVIETYAAASTLWHTFVGPLEGSDHFLAFSGTAQPARTPEGQAARKIFRGHTALFVCASALSFS